MILTVATKYILYIFLLLLGVWCYILWKNRRLRREASQLYSMKLKTLPFIGHLHMVINKEWDVTTSILLDEIWDIVKKDIQTFCVWLGPFPLIAVWGTEDVQKVLTSTKSNEKSEEYEYLKFATGNGLLTAPKNIWRITRSHSNPLFHPRNLEHLIPVFNHNCRDMVKTLSFHLDRRQFDVYEYIMKTALKSICYLIYGPEFAIDSESNSEAFNRLLHTIERIPEIMIQRVVKPWLWNDSIFNYIYKLDLDELENVLKMTIKDQIKEFKTESFIKHPKETLNEEGTDGSHSSTNGVFTFLESYRTTRMKLLDSTEKYMKDEIYTLYLTGTDTVAGTVGSYLVALAQYPDIQDKLYDEVACVVDRDEITLEDIGKMQYLDQVYNEVLRFSSIVPLIARKCTEDLKLSECTIPAGNTVLVLLAGPHMNPKVYSNPKTFDPEHFSPENCMKRRKNNFLPFSGGPRNCIGKAYAGILTKLMVVHILRHYRLSTEMDIHSMRKKWAVMLMSADGYNIKLQRRDGK